MFKKLFKKRITDKNRADYEATDVEMFDHFYLIIKKHAEKTQKLVEETKIRIANGTVTDDDFLRVKSETDLVEFYMKLMKDRCKKLWE